MIRSPCSFNWFEFNETRVRPTSQQHDVLFIFNHLYTYNLDTRAPFRFVCLFLFQPFEIRCAVHIDLNDRASERAVIMVNENFSVANLHFACKRTTIKLTQSVKNKSYTVVGCLERCVLSRHKLIRRVPLRREKKPSCCNSACSFN